MGAWSPSAVAIQIGSFIVFWYGLIMAVAVALCWWLAWRRAAQRQLERRHVENVLLWLVVGGIIGARLAEVLFFEPAYYLVHPGEILAIWHGGLSIIGAVGGGALALWGYCRRHQLSWYRYADLIAGVLPLGQAIGRWGNFFNQELYGRPTSLPWGLPINPEYRLPGYEQYTYFHPVFLYESLLSLALFAFLTWYSRRRPAQPGQVMLLYLMGYSLIRFWLEFLRIDPTLAWGLRLPQYLALLVLVIASFAWRRIARIPQGSNN